MHNWLQGNLVLKDFNIKKAANGSGKVVVKEFPVDVRRNMMEIHLFWAGKGATWIPDEGYGPLISAISVDAGMPLSLITPCIVFFFFYFFCCPCEFHSPG